MRSPSRVRVVIFWDCLLAERLDSNSIFRACMSMIAIGYDKQLQRRSKRVKFTTRSFGSCSRTGVCAGLQPEGQCKQTNKGHQRDCWESACTSLFEKRQRYQP